jgi:hypothetical protein
MEYNLTHPHLEDIACSLSKSTIADWVIAICYIYIIIFMVFNLSILLEYMSL